MLVFLLIKILYNNFLYKICSIFLAFSPKGRFFLEQRFYDDNGSYPSILYILFITIAPKIQKYYRKSYYKK